MNVQNIGLSRETTGEVLVSSAEKVFVNETLKNNSMHIRQNKNETDHWTEKSSAIYARLPDIQQFAATQPSPVCRPNLNVALPDWRWDNITKFKRIYFYHARKA